MQLELLLTKLAQDFPKDQVLTSPADTHAYGYDNSREHARPDAVFFANSQDDIVKLVKLCNEYKVPIIARGRATNTTGACVPSQGGVVLSTERMQKIIKISPENRYIEVEPGVLNIEVQNIAKQHGFFWAPDPTSAPYCSVGGNLATNAAGPRAIKYGAVRENTLGLNAVTGTGEIIKAGGYTTKGAVGYDLTRLLIGSEGTLGIISKIILKLTPVFQTTVTIQAFYQDMLAAASAVSNIMATAVTPSKIEFIDTNALNMVRADHQNTIPDHAGALLIIEIDSSKAAIDSEVNIIKQAAQNSQSVSLKVCQDQEEVNALWQIRKSLSQNLRKLSPHKINEDVIVPVANMPKLIEFTNQLAKKYDFLIVNFGHAGNGNIHVNILVDPLDKIQGPKSQECLKELFAKTLELDGTISGEHGIGIAKQAYIPLAIDEATLNLMRNIKHAFDPNNILNPGKIFSI